ncbi:potassium/proton antiporter regulatory subunit, CPA2 family (TC 2.A.37.5.2) [Stackebrandtia albiflava]|uniref:Potassium/proton antiporter regulatory subunit, CPA2 family (TC 2.A.37.5.2) n=1 Tax=Stackebrandtia albiflava TaxID=406432 RepID=A0A562VC79_9ACTN|nr:cation:proton antiporter regulatory subunit [Stackebrandtia albiflava]TWJ15421.1 potassium/proton antiporter regulatory subunit, CPA2 family (TC 2.A.37.5.2) [Stackebrandtia albiflava]
MDVERTALPGIGLRYEFQTQRGRRMGVVTHRSGRREVVIYDPDDPDSTTECVVLSGEEANVLAELLGGARIVERLAELERQAVGLVSRQVRIHSGSPYDGRALADTQARTRTGASIVAVVRHGEVIASPRPDFRFEAGDVVVVIGTEDGTSAVETLLANG